MLLARTQTRPPRLWAAVAGVVGVVATAVGAGLGVRHAMKTGLSFTSVAGLALLVAGVVLLTFATREAWHATRRWQRLWLVPVAVVSVTVMWSTALAVMFAFSPRSSLGAATPASRGLSYADVSFRAADGVLLSGWYVATRNSAAVVVLPGAGSTRTAVLDQAAVLAGHGYGTLLVDPRGQGRSQGRAMDLGWYGDRDVAAAVAFVREQPGVDASRVAVVGMSMGGEEAIGAAAAHLGIRAVVAEGATTRTAADKRGWLPGGVAGFLQRGIDRLSYGLTDLLTTAPRPAPLHAAIAQATGTQFLLITAGDVADEAQAAAYFRTAAPSRVRVWTVPQAGHVQALKTKPRGWTARVTSFLDATLG